MKPRHEESFLSLHISTKTHHYFSNKYVTFTAILQWPLHAKPQQNCRCALRGRIGRSGYIQQFRSCLTQGLDRDQWSDSRSIHSNPGKRAPLYPLNRRLDGAQGQAGRLGEGKEHLLFLPGIEPRILAFSYCKIFTVPKTLPRLFLCCSVEQFKNTEFGT